MNYKKTLLLASIAVFILVGLVTVIPYATAHRVSFLGYRAMCPFAPYSTVISFGLAAGLCLPLAKTNDKTACKGLIVEGRQKTKINRPKSVVAMAIITLIGWIATVGAWVPVITGATPPLSSWPLSYIGMIWGFVASDIVWSQLFSVIAVVGLWKMKNWGWTAALMINTIWIYTMTLSLVRALMWRLSFEILFFTPFMIYAIIASIYLWKIRRVFWSAKTN